MVTLRTQETTFGVDAKGSLAAITRNADGRNYLAAGQPAALLSLRVEGQLHAPDSAAWDAQANQLTLRYTVGGISAVVAAEARSTHVVFELMDVRPADPVEVVVWGP